MRYPEPSPSVRWGDSQQLLIPAGAIRVGGIDTRELCRVAGVPSPGVWSLMGQVNTVSAGDIAAGILFELRVRVGLGSFGSLLRFPLAPNTPFQIAMLPAQDVGVVINTSGTKASADSWLFEAWLAPFIPWEGS